MTFTRPFEEADEVQRDGTVDAIRFKTGSTGRLGFLSVRNDYIVAGKVRLSERQDLVYRADPVPATPVPEYRPAHDSGLQLAALEMTPDPVLLFRYSALTFNGHRIHYDRDYATGTEG